MAKFFGLTLSSLVKEALPSLEDLVSHGATLDEAVNLLKDAGYDLSSDDISPVFSKLQENVFKQEYLSTLDKNAIPDIAFLGVAPNALRNNIHYIIQVNGRDLLTNEPVQTNITMKYDYPVSIEQAKLDAQIYVETQAQNALKFAGQHYGQTVDDSDVLDVLVSPDADF